MITLQPVFQALGYRDETQQRNLIKLLEASGAFGELPGVDGTLDDKQALAILNAITFDSPEHAAHWLHDATQKYMLRNPLNTNDYQCQEPAYFQQNRGELLNALHQIGAISEAKPREKHYDHVLVLGSMEGTVSTRLDLLKDIYDQGVRFDKIHLLGSERPLDPAHEPIARVATDVGAVMTEMQMMTAHAYEKSERWPEPLQNVRMFSVNTFNQPDGHRANTRDTIESWLKAKPNPGRVLVISSQPNVAYQDAAVKSVLPPEFTVETVGARIGEDGLKITVAMDAIARQIDVGFPKLLETLKTQPTVQPALRLIDPACIEADPATYQFRFNGDAKTGVTKEHCFTADRWDPILHGDPLLVHERLDGKLFVADGHHRLELAKRLNATGQGPDKLAAQILREADGYTAQDVKIIAAYKNLAQGHTKPAEAALVFKEAEQVNQALLPKIDTGKGPLALSYTMSKLSRPALDIVLKDEVPAEVAAEVARRTGDAGKQEQALRIISLKLHQNYANYPQQPANYETHMQLHSQPPAAPQPAPTISDIPGFLAKLQQKRAANTETGLGLG